jgi:recombination associated protein RdgC
MWFRNLYLFRFLKPFSTDAEALNEKLAALPFIPCGSLETERLGWVAPLGRHGSELVHAAGPVMMVCLRRQQRLLPASVVKEEVDERAAIIEAEQGRDVGRKERKDLRDLVTQELLPKAFTRSRDTYAYIDPQRGWLVVDTATAGVAESLTESLRECVGSLPIAPPAVRQAPASVLTTWVETGQPSDGFMLEDSCEMRSADGEGGVVRCSGQDLGAEEVLAHLEAGKQVVRLGIEWRDRLSCVVSDDLTVRRLRFGDEILDAADEAGSEDAAARFDADFALMTGELGEFIGELIAAFGGEEERQAGAGEDTSDPF